MSSTQDVIDDFINNAEKLYDQNIKGEDGFSVDFQKLKHLSASLKISSDSQYKSSAGEKPENKKKNRYKDILPFDTTRVKLSTINNASDYINASFIKGTDGKNSYIASQGPLPHTVTDFWRMLWEYRISTIVMVCREIELGKQKCERYWPQEQELKQYDDILIILEKRKISQIQYKAWPDHGVPRIRDEILNMIKYARDIQPYSMDSQVPLCIHCSAGCGRTGAVLAIDYFRNLLLHKKLLRSITVFNVVAEMRKQRPAVVQTKDQYEFVHLAVSEMFVKYIKDQGGVSNSSLSRALVSKNYENVTITPKPPPSSQKPTSAGNNDEPGRPFEQAKHRKSLNQKDNQVMSPMHRPEDFLGPPPPKPSRGDRPQRGSPLTRPVSSYETSNFRYGGGQLNKPNQDGGRKMSTPALKETQQPSAKPAVRKQLSNNSPPVKKTTALPMRPNTASNSTYPPNQISGAMSSNIKPKPRSQAPTGISLADYTKAAGKPDASSKPIKHMPAASSILFAPNKHDPKLPGSNPKPHDKVPPAIKPKPNKALTKPEETKVPESIEARKQRLWPQGFQKETSPMQKSNVSASVFDLRDIHEQPPIKPKKQFKRTASVDRDIRSPATAALHQSSKPDTRNSFHSRNNNNNNNSKVNAAKHKFEAVKPTEKDTDKPAVKKSAITSKTNQFITTDHKTNPDSQKISTTPVTTTNSTGAYTDIVTNTTHEVARTSPTYNVLQRSIKDKTATPASYEVVKPLAPEKPKPPEKPTKPDATENLYNSFQRTVRHKPKLTCASPYSSIDIRSASESSYLHSKSNHLPIALGPMPYRTPISSTSSSVFETSPTTEPTHDPYSAVAHDPHGLVVTQDNKPALTSKPQPPLKPKRTIKRNNNPYKAQTTEDKAVVNSGAASPTSPRELYASVGGKYAEITLPESSMYSAISRDEADGPMYASVARESPADTMYSGITRDEPAYYSVPAESMNLSHPTQFTGKQVNSDYSEISSQDSNSIANPAYNPSLLPEGNVPARMPTRSSVDMPPLPERTAASYQCIDPDDYSLASDPAARQYEDLNSNTKSTQDTKERRSSSAGGLSGYKAKAKNALGKTTNVLNEAIHQFSTGRQKSEDLSSPRARQQGYSQEPHMLNGQDISFGHRYQMRPTGPRPTPNHWK
uniref:tyrosine-protein phosphatase non-receptor type 12-like isoform X2 n=1 Tax=Ciona intestinalis TaxID=7719 RepID=UPI00089DC808|nr:tyrosine-protein phosphatase non-receptor type 12-like isoform X2 [Ciona intestinalis]|eukprot:XP_018668381.1 tyrosine-protein phosphatase non-receptor type 12-like isoform X2 [Ciona intestinalis]